MTTESPKRKRGKQPFQRTPEIEEEILERLANGEPLAKICRDAHTPSVVTVWEWEKADADFSERVARARQAGHDQIALDSMMIADTQEIGVIRKIEGDKVTETHEDMLGRRHAPQAAGLLGPEALRRPRATRRRGNARTRREQAIGVG